MRGAKVQEMQPVEGAVVTFVPYDRDSIFEALAERAAEPEPEIPEGLRQQFDQVIEAQQEWRDAEAQWIEARDQQRRSAERVNSLDARRQELFERFDSLQKATVSRADSVRAVIATWEEEAFRDYTDITDSILRGEGVEEIPADTTGADGYVTVSLPTGEWWVYSRRNSGPFEELY